MADSKTIIEIDAEPQEFLSVRLVGIMYEVLPPKDSFTLELASQSSDLSKISAQAGTDLSKVTSLKAMLDNWIEQAFADQAAEIHDRLKDPKDLLDIRHIMQLMEKLVEATTGNPTTSPSGSPASRATTGRNSTGSPSRSTSRV